MATIKGKWVFNDAITFGEHFEQDVNFTSNGQSFTVLKTEHNVDFGYAFMYYDADWTYTDYSTSWLGEAYKTVDFGDVEQSVSDVCRAYMDINAVPIDEVPIGTVSIEYNGSTIASLFAGQKATLACEGMKMETDVVEVAEQKEPVMQEKTVTENGEVLPDAGYDGLNKVTVNVASGGIAMPAVKLKISGAVNFTAGNITPTMVVDLNDISDLSVTKGE